MLKPNTKKPHASNLRKHRRTDASGTFFVTKCLEPKKNILIGSSADTICQSICYYAQTEKIMLAGFVVMPDHWHAVFAPLEEETIKHRMQTIGRWIGKKLNPILLHNEVQWQDGYFETRIRSSKQFKYVLAYIENNPVRAGLTANKAEWKWSSAFPDSRKFLRLPWPWKFEKDI